ncbi:MAG: SRPBCC family protein [Bryobacteraceae bacterium]
MAAKTRAWMALVLLGLVVSASIELVHRGIYGWTIFIAVPLCAGAIASWAFRPRTAGEAIGTGALTGFVGSCFFLALGVEGIICVVMALIPAIMLSVAGSMIAYCCLGYEDNRTAAMVLLLPMSVWFDTHAKPPVYVVRTSLIINAPPQRVWRYTVAFPDITQSPDWVLRTGVAYPKGTRLEGTGLGATRYCDLSTGPVVERVVAWEPPYLLKFRVISTPPSMEETGLYGPIYPKHLTGYYKSKAGQFTLTPLPRGRTLLEGTSWYQHGLWPAEYWRWWSDAIVHRIHARVLEHIRSLSEGPA